MWYQSGTRIGLLISDNTTLIFSPTPLLIEAGSCQPQRPNAIELRSAPEEVARDTGVGANGDGGRIVGMAPVSLEQIKAVEEDLANAPPLKFDLARRVRVFTSRFQFVELEMTGCYVSRKKVAIPSSLVGLARHGDVESQFHAHFNLVNKAALEVRTRKDRVINEKSLTRQRQDIEKRFLIQLKGYGKVVLRANKEKLKHAVCCLREAVKVFQRGIKEKLQVQMDANAKALMEGLLPAVKANPPDAYTKVHGPEVTEAYVREWLEKEIREAFGKAENLSQEMKVSLVLKDVAYESLVDKRFLAVAREAMPEVHFLHDEYEAAQGVQPQQRLFR